METNPTLGCRLNNLCNEWYDIKQLLGALVVRLVDESFHIHLKEQYWLVLGQCQQAKPMSKVLQQRPV